MSLQTYLNLDEEAYALQLMASAEKKNLDRSIIPDLSLIARYL